MIVVDASVAVKWLVAEPDAERALAMLNSGTALFAPDLVRVEIANALARRVRDGRFSPEDAQVAYAKWGRLLAQGVLTLKPTDELIDRAFEIAIEAKHATADCVYLACAEMLGMVVLTADKTMHERGRKVYERIELLGNAA